MTTETMPAGVDESAASADQKITQLLGGMWAMQAVAAAAKLGIADLLASGPRTAAEIAESLDSHPGATHRLLRALASLDVLATVAGGRYELTPVGERLRTDRPTGTLKDMFIAETDTVHWRSWQHLVDAVRTGEPRPQPVFGIPVFEYYPRNPAEGEQFGRAMENVSRFAANAVLTGYDFAGVRTILDVGGGNGSMTRAILQANRGAQGIVFDLPYIEESANEQTRAEGLQDRCRFVAGNFFESVPQGADLHVLKFVLHDWSDEDSVRLLRSCRAAIPADGRLLVVESIVPEEIQPGMVYLMDLNMLVMTGGLERTAREYETLLERAGFRASRVIPTASPFSLIEARPA